MFACRSPGSGRRPRRGPRSCRRTCDAGRRPGRRSPATARSWLDPVVVKNLAVRTLLTIAVRYRAFSFLINFASRPAQSDARGQVEHAATVPAAEGLEQVVLGLPSTAATRMNATPGRILP